MTDYYKRGDIVYANFNPAIGSEQNGIRPALVLQNDIGNKYSHTVIVAAITTSHKKELPTHINLNSVDFLEQNSTLLLEQIRTIDKDRIQKYVGALSPALMIAVDYALAVSIGLNKRPSKELIMSLCPSCAQIFYNSPYHDIYREDTMQEVKENCTYCSVNDGFTYVITPKPNYEE